MNNKNPDDNLIPESLREVWRWKEAVARKYGGLESADLVQRMNDAADRIMRENNLNLPRTSASPRAK